MKILAKLLLGFISVAVLCAVVGIVGIVQLGSLSNELKTVQDEILPSITNIMLIDTNLQKIKAAVRSLTNEQGSDDAAFIKRQLANIESARTDYTKAIQDYDKILRVPEEDKLWRTDQDKLAIAKAYNNELIDMANKAITAGPGPVRSDIFAQMYPIISGERRLEFDNAISANAELLKFVSQYYGITLIDQAQAAGAVGSTILIIVTILSFIVAIVLGIFLGQGISNPLKKTVAILDKVAAGDISQKLEIKSKDEFQQVAASVNNAETNIGKLIADAVMLSQAAIDGKLATRADASKHQGDYRKIVEGVNKTLDAVIGPLNVAANYVDRISKGDIPPKITDSYSGDFNEIKNNLNQCVDAVNSLVVDAGMLVGAAVDGKLATRADATKHQGDYRKIVEGVNKTLDAVIGPLNVAANYVDRISKGDLPPKITDTYNGDFNEIKNNLNTAIGSINALVADAGMLGQAAIDGKLATRADATKHQGDYKKIVDGVNKTLDSVIGPLNVAANYVDKISAGEIPPKITDNYNGDFNTIKNNLNKAIDAVNALVADAGMLAQAALDGKLATRADASKHQGDYKKIVEGVNHTLDSVIGPLNVAANYVDKISAGEIPPKITDNYNGDFNTIKNNLNKAIDAVNALVTDSLMLAQAAVEGRLQTRADAAKHQGDYRKIVDGVNRTLDLVITPINETSAVLKRMAEGDLTTRILSDYKGDFDVLKISLNDTLGSINDTLTQVNTAVDQVAEGSGQVAQASQSLSQGATEQASSLEEITSSVTEISAQTKTNTDNAIKVNGLAKTAKENAEKGNEQMKDLVTAMTDINTSAEGIKKIVKAIDDISFQINLLALNANVEAARAGKYGKGFAVVAEEVRNLAIRSANSVKETTGMVDEAISNIGRGNELVGVTAKQLSAIVEGAGQVADLSEEVAKAGKEQAVGLEQISQGLGQIDQVTQANTASAEESASASEELSSQSQQVKSMLSRFKLSARESKMTDADMIKMMRSEMSRQQHSGSKAMPAIAYQAGQTKSPVRRINPAEVISLDDDDFGKF